MGALSNLLNVLGIVFLSHAVYSAYEHSMLPSSSLPTPPSRLLPALIDPKCNLPTDIVAETILSVLILCVGVVLAAPDLKPIQWSTWAGKLEKDKSLQLVREFGQSAGNPYAALEERPGFVDVRGRKGEFEGWVKEGRGGGK